MCVSLSLSLNTVTDMNPEQSSDVLLSDKYRSHLIGEGEKNTHWRHGGPPNYDLVNELFEKGRTQASS